MVSLRLFSHYLSVREFGILLPATQLLNYIPFLDGGVRTASNCKLLALESGDETVGLVRFCQKFYSWFSIVTIGAVSVLMLAYWLIPNVHASGGSLPFFLGLGISMAFLMMSSSQGGLLVGLQAQNLFYLIGGAGTLINLIGLATGLHFGFRLWAFLATWPAYSWAIKSKVPGLRIFDFHLTIGFWNEFRSLRRAAFNSFRCQVSIMLLFSVDLIIAQTCSRPEEVAIYGLFARIFGIVRSFIQSIGDVTWPIFAQHKAAAREWSLLLLRGNAWIHGSVSGAIAICLIPFLQWYMGSAWTGSTDLLLLILLRFVVTGLQNPAAYFLISASQFQVLARYIEFELAAAVTLSALFARHGTNGLATAFLLATACGTFYPILSAYSKILGFNGLLLLRGLWLRAILGFVASVTISRILLPSLPGGFSVLAGAIGTAAGITLPFCIAYLRFHQNKQSRNLNFGLKEILARI